MTRFGALTEADLRKLRAAGPTYEHLGSTLTHRVPTGIRRVERSVRVGTGAGALAAGRQALRQWGPQRSLGMAVAPHDVAPDLGETVVLGLGISRGRLAVPNRVVAVVDEPGRYGYAYGTLPGHPERGEELFLLTTLANDDVMLTIRADSEPAGPLRHVRPAVDTLQMAALRRYLAAVRTAVRRSGHGG